MFDGERALHLREQVAFETRHENGKTCHRHSARRVGGNFQKGLGIGDNELGWCFEPIQGVAQFALFHDHAIRIAVEQVADRLYLWQNQAALGRFLVNRHHQHGKFARANQIAENGRAVDKVRRRGIESAWRNSKIPLPRSSRSPDHAQFFAPLCFLASVKIPTST